MHLLEKSSSGDSYDPVFCNVASVCGNARRIKMQAIRCKLVGAQDCNPLDRSRFDCDASNIERLNELNAFFLFALLVAFWQAERSVISDLGFWSASCSVGLFPFY